MENQSITGFFFFLIIHFPVIISDFEYLHVLLLQYDIVPDELDGIVKDIVKNQTHRVPVE